jgi:hypothetical protein
MSLGVGLVFGEAGSMADEEKLAALTAGQMREIFLSLGCSEFRVLRRNPSTGWNRAVED